MSSAVEFAKYEGLGNDFIVLDADGPLEPETVARLCDRHFGIGADGVLVVAEAKSGGARARMIVQNADGSRPEMCGNGLRCVALRLAERDGRASAEYSIDTDAGVRRCEVSRRDGSGDVAIDMGEARSTGVHVASFGDETRAFELVSVGNPHAVAIDFFPGNDRIDQWAPTVSQSLPDGANVEFVKERAPGAFDVVVWERGVGRTLACGTGAAAVASVLARMGRVGFDSRVELWLPGGRLDLWVAPGSFAVRLKGPARRVFRGVLEDPLRGYAGTSRFPEGTAR